MWRLFRSCHGRGMNVPSTGVAVISVGKNGRNGVKLESGVSVSIGTDVLVGGGTAVSVGMGVSVGGMVGVSVGTGVFVGSGVSVGAEVGVLDGIEVRVGRGVFVFSGESSFEGRSGLLLARGGCSRKTSISSMAVPSFSKVILMNLAG